MTNSKKNRNNFKFCFKVNILNRLKSIRVILDKAFKKLNFIVLAMFTHYLLYQVYSEKATFTLPLWEFTACNLGKKVLGICL